MSQIFNKPLNDSNPDQIYFDLTVSNFQNTNTVPQVFSFNDSRTTAFVNKPDDYFLSILRFTVDSGTIPVFIPSIEPNQADPNLTIYSVSLSYTYPPAPDPAAVTYVSQQYIQWVPQNANVPVPPAPSANFNGQQNNSTGYYDCFNYTWFVFLVYEAYVNAYADLTAQVAVAGGLLPSDYPPLINWDTTSNRAVIYAEYPGYDVADLDSIGIFMNPALFSLFQTFPARYEGYDVLLGQNVKMLVTNIGGTNTAQITPPGGDPLVDAWTAITLYQESSTTSSWTPITAVVFTTNTLPINANQVSTPLVYSDNQLVSLGGNNSATQNIITDIVSDEGLYRPNLVYLPQAEYRLIDLYGNQPLHNIDIQIFYRLKSGELVPFRLQSGGAVTIKIAFLRKNSRYGNKRL